MEKSLVSLQVIRRIIECRLCLALHFLGLGNVVGSGSISQLLILRQGRAPRGKELVALEEQIGIIHNE